LATTVLGISPVDFWRMSPTEVWWIYEAKIPESKRQTHKEKWGKIEKLLGTTGHLYGS
jgi:hypothetical protein